MKTLKKYTIALAGLLIMAMVVSLTPAALAGGTQVSFPLMALNGADMIADASTSYVVYLNQDPVSKMITATVTVANGASGSGAKPIVFSGVGVELSFSDKVAPYRYTPANTSDPHLFAPDRLYVGGPNDSLAEFGKYCYMPTPGFNSAGSSAIQNNTGGRFIGAKVSTVKDSETISLSPGSKVVIAQLFFMPVNGEDSLDINMFSFRWETYPAKIIRLSTWIANGTRFVVSNSNYTTGTAQYVLSPNTFKLHVAQGKPDVSANNAERKINGYDPSVMEWSYLAEGPFQGGAPVVKDEAHVIYVRKAGTDYTGNDPEYGNYKKYMAGEAAAVMFDKNFVSCEDDVSISKTSENLTRSDGKTYVGDILLYTITAKNDGDPLSVWADAVMTDSLPVGVTFSGNVKLGGETLYPGTGYTFSGGTLTVPLGDIPGKTQKTVVFEATVNADAFGQLVKNSVSVSGKDGAGGDDLDSSTEEEDGGRVVTGKTGIPVIDEINDGDRTITGTGTPGATIEITFPNTNLTGSATVGPDGTWTVNVPGSVNLVEGGKVTATQTVDGMDPSEPAEATVQAKKNVIPYMNKTSENLTSDDGKTRVNDTLLYTVTVRNDGSVKSIWVNAVMTDTLPAGVTLKNETVLLDGKVPTYFYYEAATRTLLVSIEGGITGGQTRVITFEATVNADSFGLSIKNSATVDGKENGSTGPDISGGAEETGDGRVVTDKSDPPSVDDINRGDNAITGTGEPGAEIIVTLENGEEFTTIVDENGEWTVELPPGKEPDTGDKITVTQVGQGKDPSDEIIVIVKDKNYRAVRGFVWPMVDDDLDLGGAFLARHDIVVELRPTFLTPAGEGLSVISVLVPNSSRAGLGEFVIENVPFGDYVLTIKRPGYLVRAMKVSVSAADPDVIALAPPGTDDDGVFNLWWGDCNDDFRIDNEDVMMIMELMNIGVGANHPLYNAACDFNADGRCDNEDIMMVLERWNRHVGEYAGAGDVDFFD